jgi:hypothetical protein
VAKRTCKALRADGQPCGAAPLVESEFCSMHDPANAETMAEARRLGGQRRKREATLAGVYDLSGLASVQAVQRIIEIAVLDTLSLDNGVARNRTLLAGAQSALRALETGELADRVEALEAIVKRQGPQPSAFAADDDLVEEA